MKEFKIGGKVTISEEESYRIIDIVERNGKTYYFSCTEKKPIVPKIFERIEEDGEVYIKIVDDSEIMRDIAAKIIEESYDENTTEISKK